MTLTLKMQNQCRKETKVKCKTATITNKLRMDHVQKKLWHAKLERPFPHSTASVRLAADVNGAPGTCYKRTRVPVQLPTVNTDSMRYGYSESTSLYW